MISSLTVKPMGQTGEEFNLFTSQLISRSEMPLRVHLI